MKTLQVGCGTAAVRDGMNEGIDELHGVKVKGRSAAVWAAVDSFYVNVVHLN